VGQFASVNRTTWHDSDLESRPRLEAIVSNVRDHLTDPVDVYHSADFVTLRIGNTGRGEPRYALLEPDEARRVGIALIAAAEAVKPQQIPRPHTDALAARMLRASGGELPIAGQENG
jgi:hypothetical protein